MESIRTGGRAAGAAIRFLAQGLIPLHDFVCRPLRLTGRSARAGHIRIGGRGLGVATSVVVFLLAIGALGVAELIMGALQIRCGVPLRACPIRLLDERFRAGHLIRRLRPLRRASADDQGRRRMLVALTGWGQEADRLRALQAGFDHHILKPAEISRRQVLLASAGGSGTG